MRRLCCVGSGYSELRRNAGICRSVWICWRMFQIPGALSSSAPSTDQKTTVSGLKEALSIGTENAVKSVSKTDGYLGNKMIQDTVCPKRFRRQPTWRAKWGFSPRWIISLWPWTGQRKGRRQRRQPFLYRPLKEMTFDDAQKILRGGNTSATEFFKGKTSQKLYGEFSR